MARYKAVFSRTYDIKANSKEEAIAVAELKLYDDYQRIDQICELLELKVTGSKHLRYSLSKIGHLKKKK